MREAMFEDGDLGSEFKPLSGTDEATVDEKGRILVSKKKRDRLGENFVMMVSESGVVAAYPQDTFRDICREIESVPKINLGRQQYIRLVIGTAEQDLNFDAQGRVVIPQKLRDQGKIVDKVVLVGAYDKLEIWAKSEWEKYSEDPDSYGEHRLAAITKAMNLMGIK